ncbi:MAG: cytochrome b/b6 domain-containing protein, partial [Exilibacterium sp.]
MKLGNTQTQYGLVTILLHWIIAILVIGLFALGLYMTDLTYYDPWYRKGPDLHRSLGIIVALLLLLR